MVGGLGPAEAGYSTSVEDDLGRRERELADFFENAGVPLHWVGQDGTVLRVNRAELDLLGYRREEYVGRHIAEFHADRPVIDEALERLIRGESLVAYPARMRHKDGSIRDVLIHSSGLFENGEFIHTRCVTLDVTEQRRTEQELRQSEERYRHLAELLPAGVYTCDPAGVITYSNGAAARLWGRSPRPGDTDERFCGSDQMALPDGTVLPHEECPMAVALAEGRAFRNEEVVIRRADGTQVTVLVNIDPILGDDGAVLGAVNVFHDVSELKRARRALGEQKENLETLLELLPVSVFIAHDPECRRISGNRAAEELLRMPRGSNLSKTAPAGEQPKHFQVFREGRPIPPEELPIQRAARGEVVWSESLDHRFEDGCVVHTLVSAQPLYDPTGRPRGAVASILDITELKQAEYALREADRRKDEFLASLSHELRNPLAPIGYALQIMRSAEGDGDLLLEARRVMERQLGHLVRLVDDLLDVSRITHDKLEIRIERIDLAIVLERAVESCRPFLEEADHELSVDLPAEPIPLRADPVRLTQVFGNLIHNACKYTEPGGHIWVRAERRGTDAAVRVRDDGIGMCSELIPRVFERFSRAERHGRQGQGGLGIGLTLVKRLVEMHGGSVEAASEGPGRGSEFVVRLPVRLDADEALPCPEAGDGTAVSPDIARAAPARGRRVLVVDDNRDSAAALSQLLELRGDEVFTAHDGAGATESAERLRPEVVLLDLGLPDVDGRDVCRTIRQRPWGREVVVVAVTGWGQESDRQATREAGFDGHLVKPVQLEDVVPFLELD